MRRRVSKKIIARISSSSLSSPFSLPLPLARGSDDDKSSLQRGLWYTLTTIVKKNAPQCFFPSQFSCGNNKGRKCSVAILITAAFIVALFSLNIFTRMTPEGKDPFGVTMIYQSLTLPVLVQKSRSETTPVARIVNYLYHHNHSNNGPHQFSSSDWISHWSTYPLSLHKVSADPHDRRATMRGSGSIISPQQSSIVSFHKSPRLYISGPWDGVEFTVYGKYLQNTGKWNEAGLTLGARSSHNLYKIDGCNAAGYYVKILEQTGEIGFIKEYFHDRDNQMVYGRENHKSVIRGKENGTNGTSAKEDSMEIVTHVPYFEGGIPKNTWIGLKFIVFTQPKNQPQLQSLSEAASDSVRLELYIDRTNGENGGKWELAHTLEDSAGAWPALTPLPKQCPVKDGDPIIGERDICMLRGTGSEIQWKHASIRNIVGDKIQNPPILVNK